MKKYFIIWFVTLFLFSTENFAQKVYSYEKGIIITKTGDTLNCYLPISVYYSDVIYYKSDKGGFDNIIETDEIKILRTPYNTFENITANDKEYLMRIVINGKITLYSYVIPDESTNYTGGLYLFKAPTILYAIKKENSLYMFNEKNYIELLSEHLNDCPQLTKNLGSKGYKYADIEKIIDEYNKCNN